MSASASSACRSASGSRSATSFAPPCFGPRSAPMRAGDGGIHIRAGARDHARGERRCVEFVLGVEIERRVHRLHPVCARLAAVQQMQEMAADRVVVGLDFDAPAVVAEVVPVEQHRAERGHQAVGDVARTRRVVVVFLGQHACRAPRRRCASRPWVRGGRDALERLLHGGRQAAQRLSFALYAAQFRRVRQLAVHQQIGDLLEFARVGEVENVVAAIVQIVAGVADGAQRRRTFPSRAFRRNARNRSSAWNG